jgi:hypothetical protein
MNFAIAMPKKNKITCHQHAVNLKNMIWVSAQKDFIIFCPCESCNTYKMTQSALNTCLTSEDSSLVGCYAASLGEQFLKC